MPDRSHDMFLTLHTGHLAFASVLARNGRQAGSSPRLASRRRILHFKCGGHRAICQVLQQSPRKLPCKSQMKVGISSSFSACQTSSSLGAPSQLSASSLHAFPAPFLSPRVSLPVEQNINNGRLTSTWSIYLLLVLVLEFLAFGSGDAVTRFVLAVV